MFELAGNAFRLASSVRGIEARQENVSGLSQSIAYVRKGVQLPFALCNKVTEYASEYIISKVIIGARYIPGAQSLFESHCQRVSIRCASKCRKHASQLSNLVPKNDGVFSVATSYLSASTSHVALGSWFGTSSLWVEVGSFIVDKIVAPSMTAQLDAQLASAVFFPLVCKLHESAGRSFTKLGIDMAIWSTVNVAVGGLGLTDQVARFSKSTTIAEHATSATIIGINAYVYGQPLIKGGKFVMQSCLKARQIKKIDAALNEMDLSVLIENIKGLNIPFVNQATRPIVKGVVIALIDSGLCGTMNFATLVGNKKALNFWLVRQVEVLTLLTNSNKRE